MPDWRLNPPTSFFDTEGEPYSPETIAENFQLDAEHNIYFDSYSDWKKKYAEDEYELAESESVALLGGDDPLTEEVESGEGLLKTMYDARSTRLGEKKDEAADSLAQGIGSTFGQLANQYKDAVSQSVGQQTSFTSGASGRGKQEAFSRTQEAMNTAATTQNLKFTTASRDLTQAGTELDAQYDYDVGAAGRDLEQAGITRDYKEEKGKEDWEDSIYDSLKQLANRDAWGEEEDPDDDKKLCCFIVLEVEEKNVLNKDVRKYRDEMMNDCNRAGYYKLAQVVVPLMRKSKLMKLFFKYLFVNPAKSWAKWHYHDKGIGWIFEPLRRFWLGMFTYLGKDHKLRVDNG